MSNSPSAGRGAIALMFIVALVAQVPLVLYIVFALPAAAQQSIDRALDGQQGRALVSDLQELHQRASASAASAQRAMDRAERAASHAEGATAGVQSEPAQLSLRLDALEEAIAQQSRQLEMLRIALQSRSPHELDSLRNDVRHLQAEATIREEEVQRLRRTVEGGPLAGLDALRNDVRGLSADVANRSRDIDDLQRALRGWTPSGLDPLRQDVRDLEEEASQRERDLERFRQEIRDLGERVRRLEQRPPG